MAIADGVAFPGFTPGALDPLVAVRGAGGGVTSAPPDGDVLFGRSRVQDDCARGAATSMAAMSKRRVRIQCCYHNTFFALKPSPGRTRCLSPEATGV